MADYLATPISADPSAMGLGGSGIGGRGLGTLRGCMRTKQAGRQAGNRQGTGNREQGTGNRVEAGAICHGTLGPQTLLDQTEKDRTDRTAM